MAATTKYLLAEEVMTLLKGGDASASTTVEMPVIIKMLEQLINANLKVDYFQTHLASGETIPDGLVLAVYEKIPVLKYKKCFSRAKLPAQPISLPRNMGVFFVGPHVSNVDLDSNVLTAVAGLTQTVILTWTLIENVQLYYLERATDESFTTNLTPLYTGNLLTFTDTGLTASTNYFYRVCGMAEGYNDSIFANTRVTTLGVGLGIFGNSFGVTFN